MAFSSLNQFRGLRELLMRLRAHWLRTVIGVATPLDIRPSLSSRFRPGRRGSITIGSETLIAFKTLIYTRDHVSGAERPVRIGARCFVGGGSMILPGVTIGDECIVGGGAVVDCDIPARSVVVGNPARIIRRDIEVGPFGRLKTADERPVEARAQRDFERKQRS